MASLDHVLQVLDLHTPAATSLTDKLIKRRLETVAGVGSADRPSRAQARAGGRAEDPAVAGCSPLNLVGEATREIQVIVDRDRLQAYHVSLPRW